MNFSQPMKEKIMSDCLEMHHKVLAVGGRIFIDEFIFIFSLMMFLNGNNLNDDVWDIPLNEVVYGAQSIMDYYLCYEIQFHLSKQSTSQTIFMLRVVEKILNDIEIDILEQEPRVMRTQSSLHKLKSILIQVLS